MHSFLLQDIVTIKGTSANTSIAQVEHEYLDLEAYQDFTGWVEVFALDAGGAGLPTLWLETAPLKDNALFVPQGGSQTRVPLSVGVLTGRNVMNAPMFDNLGRLQIPTARWLRWRLDIFVASSNWSVTFRIHVAAHSVCLPRAS